MHSMTIISHASELSTKLLQRADLLTHFTMIAAACYDGVMDALATLYSLTEVALAS